MRKIILIAALVLGIATTAAAQPKAIGLRGANGVELSYQQYLRGGANFLEFDLGLVTFNALNFAADYDWYLYQDGGFGLYGGIGAAAGFSFEKEHGGIHLAFAPQFGIEYQFNIPLQLSLDIRPQIGWSSYEAGKGGHFYSFWYPALGIRYCF